MTNEERGLYIILLALQWTQGSVSQSDMERLGLGMGLPSLSKVRSKFDILPGGDTMQNARLEVERGKQIEFRSKQAQNGKLGGRPKTQAYPKPNPAANPNHNPKKALQSPSPSSNKEEEGGMLLTKRPNTEIRPVIPEPLASDPAFLATWSSWLDHLNQKRKPPTQHAQDLQLKKLAAMGPAQAVSTLKNCIEKNWQGIYESNNGNFNINPSPSRSSSGQATITHGGSYDY